MGRLLFSFVTIAMFLVACRKEKTSWEGSWMLPLIDATLDLNHLMNDSTFTENSDGFMEVDLTRTILDVGPSELLKLPDTTIVQTFKSVIPNLNVPAGFTFVNQIEEHKLDLDGAQLKKIRLSAGQIKLTIYNPVPTTCTFIFKLPGVSKNGMEFEKIETVNPAFGTTPGSIVSIIDLSGYDIDLTGIKGSDFNMLQSLLIVSSDPNGPNIKLSSSHQFKVEAEFRNIRPEFARGYFGSKLISDTVSVNLSSLRNIVSGNIDLPAPELSIEVMNGIKVGAKATILSLKGTNSQGGMVSLTGSNLGVPFYLNEPTGNWNTLQPSVTSLLFNESNSSIESYLENLGYKHELAYQLHINPWGNVSGGFNEFYPYSRLKVKSHATMPLLVGFEGLTLQDTFKVEFTRNNDRAYISSGRLLLKATNGFPFEASTKLYLLDDQGLLLHVLSNNSVLSSALQGVFDQTLGIYKKDSDLYFELTETILKDLDRIKSIVVKAQFNTPNMNGANSPQAIPSGAFLSFKLKTQFKLKSQF